MLTQQMKRMSLLPLFFVVLTACDRTSASSEALATVESSTAVSATNGLPAWHTQITAHAAASGARNEYTECAAVTEIRGSYLCASISPRRMNEALGRASIYVEGLFDTPRRTVVSTTDSAYRRGLSSIGGHDLRSEDLNAYWNDATAACASDASRCAPAGEREFFENFLLPKLDANESFVVITYSLEGFMDWREVVTHEIMHAQYFLDEDFRIATDGYWDNEVSDADKASASDSLSPYYNVDDPLLLRNEFQAYILMAGAESNLLSHLVETHREPMLRALSARNVAPIQVQ